MSKKIEIKAKIIDDEVGFTISKTKEISNIEILGILEMIIHEVEMSLKNKIKVSKV
jgi:hypothetical protein|tara:strand:- start:582 stop:749 length:168 start_codon:yes stop_codon:yes gene_type:complete